ncbi:M48 family metallopeptidase [Pullulanibacillus sp. KACC 23026]|uniref:M48 family metallopeptidase n=1 Tax=Pullulanibacillus sp. KACC 23026 TaxID=3028315 RepID=UPI0023B0DA4E|nr:M48 family metallopeptidase [Pullulanibacillus sp. KACC 23026]WEG12000.1 M48 family metallopeptidase [Pullulanibacillus sp. KACC 23026]
MKKLAGSFVGLYVLYILLSWLYLFVFTHPGVPDAFKGTPADPNTFLNSHQVLLSQSYSRIQDWIYFINIPFEWGMYLFILIFGFSYWLRNRASEVTRFSIVHTAVYWLSLSIVTWIVTLPIDLIAHYVSVHYGVSVQPLNSWLKDSLTSFWVNWVITFIMMVVIYYFIRRSPRRWWLPVWLLAIPFTIFLMFIQPVVIDPLYNDFHALKASPLKTDILQLAAQAHIPAHNVYEVDMSGKTNAMNAYVNGIGSNLRIVLWDTTVNRLQKSEVLFVMAHEMGHYVMHHLLLSMLGTIVMILVGLYITSKIHLKIVDKWGARLGISHVGDLASIPIILLIFSVLSFVGSPIESAVSRHYEHEADAYAVKMTKDPEAGIKAFQELTKVGLSDVNPPGLIRFLTYDHPTMLERIAYLQKEEKVLGKSKSN